VPMSEQRKDDAMSNGNEIGEDHASAGQAPEPTTWSASEWHGKMLLDVDGQKIGKLQDVYVDVETDQAQFGTVKEGIFTRHLTFVPLPGARIGPDYLQVDATKDQVRSAPDIAMNGGELSQAEESALYHHFETNYVAPDTQSGRRLAKR